MWRSSSSWPRQRSRSVGVVWGLCLLKGKENRLKEVFDFSLSFFSKSRGKSDKVVEEHKNTGHV